MRRVLADLYDLAEIAVHNPRDIPDVLPNRVILQVHWYREPNFQAYLRENGFRLLVLSRHPLDVLLSVLHFVRHERQTARWLEGNVELPAELSTAKPTDSVFREYALSWGAENLLGVSYAWQHEQGVLLARYEDLVTNPAGEFGRLTAVLGAINTPLASALKSNSLSMMQASPNRHGWQGQPGLWKSLITPGLALRIYVRHKPVFQALNYKVTPHLLGARRAAYNWDRLVIPPEAS